MSRHPWYKRYAQDFIMGTMGMTLEIRGAYSLILDMMYDRGGPIPDDSRYLAGVMGVSTRKWNSIRQELLDTRKIISENGEISNQRAAIELADRTAFSEERAASGRVGGLKTSRKQAELVTNPQRTTRETEDDANETNGLAKADLKGREENQKLEEKRKKESALEDDFKEWYSVYPRKVSPADAKRAYIKARKSVTAELLLLAVRQIPKPEDIKFFPHPSTWLNGERWLDGEVGGQSATPKADIQARIEHARQHRENL